MSSFTDLDPYSIGVSLLTQLLYALVFFTRYLDLFSSYSWTFSYYGAGVLWNTPFKLTFLASSFYLIFLMMRVYPRTRERERAWKLGIWSVVGSVVIAPLAIVITYRGFPSFWLSEVSRNFLASLIHRLEHINNGVAVILGFLDRS